MRDWRQLEHLTAEEWLLRLGGTEVYDVVWRPLLEGKFGVHAREVSAVWFWNKLKLRGGSRGQGGREVLAYYRGGFAALAERLAGEICRAGGRIHLESRVSGLLVRDERVVGVRTAHGPVPADAVLATPALPVVADLVEPYADPEYTASLRRIRYLANICIVLELDRSLSDTYWLNVNDPSFPFVAVIEHTNFEPASTYTGRRLVYLSRYLPETDELYGRDDAQVVCYCLGHLQRMFPALRPEWPAGGARLAGPVRATHSRSSLRRSHPRDGDPSSGALPQQHGPGLPRGPWNQLRHPRGPARGPRDRRVARHRPAPLALIRRLPRSARGRGRR